MKTASRRFLVLVFAGTFAATGLRAGGTTDGKDRRNGNRRATGRIQKLDRTRYWAALIANGDNAQFEQEHRLPADHAYGGIQDLHFEGTFDKNGLFSVDGHALWDFNDYDITRAIGEAESRLHQGWLH